MYSMARSLLPFIRDLAMPNYLNYCVFKKELTCTERKL